MSRMHGHSNVRAATSTTARSLGESGNLCKADVSPRVLPERCVEYILRLLLACDLRGLRCVTKLVVPCFGTPELGAPDIGVAWGLGCFWAEIVIPPLFRVLAFESTSLKCCQGRPARDPHCLHLCEAHAHAEASTGVDAPAHPQQRACC